MYCIMGRKALLLHCSPYVQIINPFHNGQNNINAFISHLIVSATVSICKL